MITRMSHISIYVDDHDEALDFYVGKLGFEKRTDVSLDGFRWLTVGCKSQPDLEIVLMKLAPSPMMDEEAVTQLRDLMKKGALGTGVFSVDDCQKTYEELRGKGVEFMGEPTKRSYGTEVIMKDPFGNWFSMTQHQN